MAICANKMEREFQVQHAVNRLSRARNPQELALMFLEVAPMYQDDVRGRLHAAIGLTQGDKGSA